MCHDRWSSPYNAPKTTNLFTFFLTLLEWSVHPFVSSCLLSQVNIRPKTLSVVVDISFTHPTGILGETGPVRSNTDDNRITSVINMRKTRVFTGVNLLKRSYCPPNPTRPHQRPHLPLRGDWTVVFYGFRVEEGKLGVLLGAESTKKGAGPESPQLPTRYCFCTVPVHVKPF